MPRGDGPPGGARDHPLRDTLPHLIRLHGIAGYARVETVVGFSLICAGYGIWDVNDSGSPYCQCQVGSSRWRALALVGGDLPDGMDPRVDV